MDWTIKNKDLSKLKDKQSIKKNKWMKRRVNSWYQSGAPLARWRLFQVNQPIGWMRIYFPPLQKKKKNTWPLWSGALSNSLPVFSSVLILDDQLDQELVLKSRAKFIKNKTGRVNLCRRYSRATWAWLDQHFGVSFKPTTSNGASGEKGFLWPIGWHLHPSSLGASNSLKDKMSARL